MDAPEILEAHGVVGVALHQDQLLVERQDYLHRPLDVSDSRRARTEDPRFAFGSDVPQDLKPGDVPRSDLMSRHDRIEHVDGLEVIGGREVLDSGFITSSLEFWRPFEG